MKTNMKITALGALLSLVAVAGCGGKPTDFGVNVTVETQQLPAGVVAQISTLKLAVSGGETFSKTINGVKVQDGVIRFHYVPGVHSGSLVFAVGVLAADGTTRLGGGSSQPVTLIDGAAVDVTINLSAGAQACAADGECASNHCVDGVCCDTACTGTCEACNLTGMEGTCSPIADGQDPGAECVAAVPPMPPSTDDMGSPVDGGTPPDFSGVDMFTGYLPDGGLKVTSAACNGVCNGARACRYPGATTNCGSVFCGEETRVASMTCDGAGHCQQTYQDCNPYICGANACKTGCTAQTDCVGNSYCDGATQKCVPTKSNGVSCAQGFECTSGFCANGVCCNSACDPASVPGAVCNASGSVGTCRCSKTCATGVGCRLFYRDADNDGYGNPSVAAGTVDCDTGTPPTGYVTDNTDCDDMDGNVHPGQTGFFPTGSKGTGTYDYNCDGVQTHDSVYGGAACQLPTGSPLFGSGCSSTTSCGTSTSQTGLGVGICFVNRLLYCCASPTEGFIGDAGCGQPATYRYCYSCVANGAPSSYTTTLPMKCH